MNTNETNEQNPWRPLEPGELADVNDTECLTPDGAWVKAQGCHMYTLEEIFAEYGPTQLRTRRPRPAPIYKKGIPREKHKSQTTK